MALTEEQRAHLFTVCEEKMQHIQNLPNLKKFIGCVANDSIKCANLAALESIAASSIFQLDLREVVESALQFYYLMYVLKTGDIE